MKISQFTSNINNKGILRSNKYLANITLHPDHYLRKNDNYFDASLFQIRCDTIKLPGMNFASADGSPRLGYGPKEKHPYSIIFDELSLTFMVDSSSKIHRMLYDWVNCIVNFQGKGATDVRSKNGPVKSAAAYEVGYRDSYASTLEIDIYKDHGNDGEHVKSMTAIAYNAFPMGFPSVGLNWDSSEILKLNIPFSYTDYTVKYY